MHMFQGHVMYDAEDKPMIYEVGRNYWGAPPAGGVFGRWLSEKLVHDVGFTEVLACQPPPAASHGALRAPLGGEGERGQGRRQRGQGGSPGGGGSTPPYVHQDCAGPRAPPRASPAEPRVPS